MKIYGFLKFGWSKMRKKPFIHITTHESLLCHQKSKNHMLSNGLYLLSSLGWMKKVMSIIFQIIAHFLSYGSSLGFGNQW
jgi:hypothetical protein